MEEKEEKTNSKDNSKYLFWVQRAVALIAVFLMFIPSVNPAKISGLINKNLSLFTSAVSYSSLTGEAGRAIRTGWVSQLSFVLIFIGSILLALGIAGVAAGACMSLGNLKFKHVSVRASLAGCLSQVIGFVLIFVSYIQISGTNRIEKVQPSFPSGFYVFAVMAVIVIIVSIILFFALPKIEEEMKYEMESKYKLFLMFLPFGLLAFVFCYLPLWGWRYAFFDYRSGGTLSIDNFVGFKWFTYLFQNAATRKDIVRVLKNTLAMSGLGIATSWIPMAFAVFLSEIKNQKFRRFVQTFTTIPNFISWVLVYTLALAIFSTDGFINTFAMSQGWITEGTNYLMGDNFTWLKMLAWGTWKGVGWSAIIYIAGISGIDKQLYEAATVDGAGRFQRMWNITIPGLLPTYCVLLLMSVAGVLSNGMDQYLVFSNATNKSTMEVLDLYVYNLGITGGGISLSTVVGMVKSVVSVVLLFGANGISKLIRGESIV